jgi:hypothetical protein
MTREKWLEHIEQVSGLKPLEQGGDYAAWQEAVQYHTICRPDCPECKARKKTRMATANRKAHEQVLRDAGLVKGRTGLGRVIWE